MKTLILSLALAALVAPCALADVGGVNNTAIAGAIGNSQFGNHNRASNELGVRQSGFVGRPGVLVGEQPGLRRLDSPAPDNMLHALFGAGPLVNNNIAVGTAVNVQNGNGNRAGNELSFGQTAGAFGPAFGGAGGGLVNNNIAVGTAVNVQNGNHNDAFNGVSFDQRAISGGFAGFGRQQEMLLPVVEAAPE